MSSSFVSFSFFSSSSSSFYSTGAGAAAYAATHLSLAPYLCRSNAVPFASVCAICFIGGGLLLALSPQAEATAAAALESELEPAPTTQTQVSRRRRRRHCRCRRCCCLHGTIHSVAQYLLRSGVWVYVRLSTPFHLDVISASLQAVSLSAAAGVLSAAALSCFLPGFSSSSCGRGGEGAFTLDTLT